MSGIGRYVVGWRITDHAARGRTDIKAGGKCISCGAVVWFARSGYDNQREKDSHAVCQDCHNRPDIKENLQREL